MSTITNNRLHLGGNGFDSKGIAVETGLKAKVKQRLGLASSVEIDGIGPVVINNMSARKWLARTTQGASQLNVSRFGKGSSANTAIQKAIQESNKDFGSILTTHALAQQSAAAPQGSFGTTHQVTQLILDESQVVAKKEQEQAAQTIQKAYRSYKRRELVKEQAEDEQNNLWLEALRKVNTKRQGTFGKIHSEIKKLNGSSLSLEDIENKIDQYPQIASAILGEISEALALNPDFSDSDVADSMDLFMAEVAHAVNRNSHEQNEALWVLRNFERLVANENAKIHLGAKLSKSNRTARSQEDAKAIRETYLSFKKARAVAHNSRVEGVCQHQLRKKAEIEEKIKKKQAEFKTVHLDIKSFDRNKLKKVKANEVHLTALAILDEIYQFQTFNPSCRPEDIEASWERNINRIKENELGSKIEKQILMKRLNLEKLLFLRSFLSSKGISFDFFQRWIDQEYTKYQQFINRAYDLQDENTA